jgi:hypothetical protein
MRSWLDTFLGVRNRGRNRPWTRRVGGRAGVQSQWNIVFLVWSDAFGRIEDALPTQFRFCVRGAANTRVPVSQNRKMSQNDSRSAANPALRGAHLGETKLRVQVGRMWTIWGYAVLDRHNGAGCVPAHRYASGHLAQGL